MMKASETLVDCLTNLERVLTTPIPFSYSAHLWFVTTIYCMALVRKFRNLIGFPFSGDQLGQLINHAVQPFQLWKTLEWITIPGTVIAVGDLLYMPMAVIDGAEKELHFLWLFGGG